jgi:competence protein ComEA
LQPVLPRIRFVPGAGLLIAMVLPLLLGLGAVAAVVAWSRLGPAPSSPPAPVDAGLEVPPPAGLLVEVTGAVLHPGLYRLPRGERVDAAIAAAGGITALADLNRLPDLAARLRDGQQVRVPFAKGPTSSVTARVNLNQATEEELVSVPGFTADLAAAAVRQRELFGGFTSIRDLVTVLGMSETDYLLARKYLTV